MSVTKDPDSPLHVPEKNREIARERARIHVKMIEDYLEVKDKIPTGFSRGELIRMQKEKILQILGGSEKDWANYKWHYKNVINKANVLERILPLLIVFDLLDGLETLSVTRLCKLFDGVHAFSFALQMVSCHTGS